MFDATQNFDAPLGAGRLFGWQAAHFPTGYSGVAKIKTGSWGDDAEGPMQGAMSERQRAILNRYLDGLEGHLTDKKCAILGKCSPASARRDIADLVEKGVLRRNPGGSKNTSYSLV